MLTEEAQWLGKRILQLDARAFPLLNIGSSTAYFRMHGQPWIDQFIFSPLRQRQLPVIHSDIKQAEGVDIAGDITSKQFCDSLRQLNIGSVLCSNVLEHVSNREEIAAAITNIVPAGGFLFVSCPHAYPYHADPIDNGFRPSPRELASVFPNTQLLEGEVIQSDTYLKQLSKDKKHAAKMFVRLLLPFYKPKSWFTLLNHWWWLFRRFSAAGVVLQKVS